jgi:hypothetical protein
MLALVSLFVVVMVSIIGIKCAAILLELTGLSRDIANFQAISAFTGTGYTTKESEIIMDHPLRRKIVQVLILGGNIGVTTSIASLILTFGGHDHDDIWLQVISLCVGLALMYTALNSQLAYRVLRKLTLKIFRDMKRQDLHDFHQVLGIGRGFGIVRLVVENDGHWMIGRALKDMKLDREGTLVLAIERKMPNSKKITFIGAPNGSTQVSAGDVLTCFGRPEAVWSLSEREPGLEGDKQHDEACAKMMEVNIQEAA